MKKEEIAIKLASLLGTTAFVTVGTVGSFYIPTSIYQTQDNLDFSRLNLFNPYEFKISLQSEEVLVQLDPAIPIPVVNKMVFKFGRPEFKKFNT